MVKYNFLKQNQLGFQLTPISIRDFAFMQECPCEVYSFNEERFELILQRGDDLNRDIIKNLVLKGHWRLFISFHDKAIIKSIHQENLRKVTRSLSIGDPLQNAKKQIKLLTLNMEQLYNDPTDDEILSLQHQSIKNLAAFLLNNPKIHRQLYKELTKTNFHYAFTQPLLSSIMLLAFLKQTFHFSAKEMESLFVVSYFKDIGMSLVPNSVLNKNDLTEMEKRALHSHPAQSLKILEGRIPLTPEYLQIVENHHSHSMISPDEEDHINEETIVGVETTIIAAMDTIAAMTTPRPYRDPETLYQALDLVKNIISVQHPQEFKYLVNFFQQFFRGK